MASNLDYTLNNMIGFSIVGVLIKLFLGRDTSTDGESGPASSSIWGYGVIALSILAGMIISFGLASQMANLKRYGVVDFVKTLLTSSLPSLLTLGILVWMITLNIMFYKKINQGKVADEYFTYSGVTTFLIILQVIALFMHLRDNSGASSTGSFVNRMAYATYGFTFLNAIFAVIMTIILEKFSTDG